MNGGQEVREIALKYGLVALIDDEDYDLVSAYQWYATTSERGHTQYAITRYGYGRGGWKTLRMHALVMGTDPEGREIDHRNRDGLDNRRTNLRWATKAQRRWNQGVRRDSQSGFKGVHLLRGRYWTATIRQFGKQLHLGYFPDAESAARAYDQKARELHGEFAYQNFPPTVSPPAHKGVPPAKDVS